MEGYIGQIIMFAGNFAPTNWAFCNGQLLSIAQNTALFSIIGTTYGGNGTTNFALPDLQGRVALHAGNGAGLTPYVLGEQGGAEAVTLTLPQIPAHNHSLMANSGNGDQLSPSGNVSATVNDGARTQYPGYSTTPNAAMSAAAISPTGGNQPHTNIQPFLAVNFIICLQGIFPSRS
ncbi:microcystin dependent protein MdpB [Methyloglobulus morosus KoM1]|uniref:Microcystin dependent protein MdpB n=1 Tax=Methyloglobulus morosus KoM1 TaxID=1116472 RepID=V5BKK0_9GAMM|nr:tail fiber protein [Methyloglobulus morosus]ESS66647.1 microcystin dependent protein MdpB [Methyloglobulus morosus KoM1]